MSGAEDAVRDDQGLENENKGIRGEVKKWKAGVPWKAEKKQFNQMSQGFDIFGQMSVMLLDWPIISLKYLCC